MRRGPACEKHGKNKAGRYRLRRCRRGPAGDKHDKKTVLLMLMMLLLLIDSCQRPLRGKLIFTPVTERSAVGCCLQDVFA